MPFFNHGQNTGRLGPDGKYAGNINQKYFVLANILYIPVACTCKVGCNVILLFICLGKHLLHSGP